MKFKVFEYKSHNFALNQQNFALLHYSETVTFRNSVMCHVSHVTRHMLCVTCHMSRVTFFFFSFFFSSNFFSLFLDKVVKLVGGGSVIYGATQPSLIRIKTKFIKIALKAKTKGVFPEQLLVLVSFSSFELIGFQHQ